MSLEKLSAWFYDRVYEISTAFPYSNHMAHFGLIGALPYIIGSCLCEKLCEKYKIKSLENKHILAGWLAAVTAEVLWQFVIEPASPYAAKTPVSDFAGVVETTTGAFIAMLYKDVLRKLGKSR